MTDEQIKKALECCFAQENCEGCPIYKDNDFDCLKEVGIEAIDLIKRKDAEIERLKAEIRNTDNAFASLDRPLIEVKSEAYKEFAAELYNNLRQYENYDTHHTYEILDRIESVEEFLLNKLVELTQNLHGTCTEGGNEPPKNDFKAKNLTSYNKKSNKNDFKEKGKIGYESRYF